MTTETLGFTGCSDLNPSAEQVPHVDDRLVRTEVAVGRMRRPDDEQVGPGQDLVEGHEVGIESDAGFEIGIELVAKARRSRQPVAEVPTIWLDRAFGPSNFKLWAWLPRYLRWYRFAFGRRLSPEEIRARSVVDR